jgi:hypothetical protein
VPNARRRTESHRRGTPAVAWIVACALCIALTGCNPTVDGIPRAPAPGMPSPPRTTAVGAILPAQLPDLLTPSSSLSVAQGSPLFEGVRNVSAVSARLHGPRSPHPGRHRAEPASAA